MQAPLPQTLHPPPVLSPLGCSLSKDLCQNIPLPPLPLLLHVQLGHLWWEEGAGDPAEGWSPSLSPTSTVSCVSFDVLALTLTPSCLLSSTQVAF